MSKTEILNCYKATLILDTQGYKESIEELISNTKNTFTELGGIINDFKDLGYKDFMRIKNRLTSSRVRVCTRVLTVSFCVPLLC